MSDQESDDNNDDLVLESRRSKRSLATSSKIGRQNVLEQLKNARSKGKTFRARVDNLVEDVYMEVGEEEYQANKQDYREFVEDDDGAGYYDDDSEDEFGEEGKSSKKKKEARKAKAKAGTIKHHFQVINSKQKPQDDRSIRVDDDDILKETLAELMGTNNEEEEMASGSAYSSELMGTNNNENEEEMAFAYSSEFMSTNNNEEMTFAYSFPPSPPRPTTPPLPIQTSQSQLQRKEMGSASTKNKENKAEMASTSVYSFPPPPPITPPPTIQTETPQLQRKRDAPMPVEMVYEDSSPTSSSRPPKIARTGTEDITITKSSIHVLKFYFLDAFEDTYKHPGTVYLFGRIKASLDGQTQTCCLVIRNVKKQLFFLKRQFSESTNKPVSLDDLNQDVQRTLKTKFNITNIHCKSKLVEKKFISSDETVPKECEALEVWINCSGRIPADLSGDCFSHVMNTTTTALERLLIERNIHGPCWLEIRNPVQAESQISHCQAEYCVNMEAMDAILMLPTSMAEPPPQISFISLNILTALHPETKENQIVMASLIHHVCNIEKPSTFDLKTLVNKRYCVISSLKGGLSLPFNLDKLLNEKKIASNMVQKVGNEIGLLNFLLKKFETLDPDMIMCHDLTSQLILLHLRLEKHKLRLWDRLGRLKRSAQIPKIGFNPKSILWELTAGRLCLDSKTAATEFIHARSYEMEDMVPNLLKLNRHNLSAEQISEPFLNSNPKVKLLDLVSWNWNETLFTLKIVEHLNAIPLFVQITQIVGGVLSRTLMGGRAERNEYLLLHACFKNNYIPPDKRTFKATIKSKASTKKTGKTSQVELGNNGEIDEAEEPDGMAMDENAPPNKKTALNKKAQYTGGLVLEPRKGLYETFIVLLDFNSLYPSIIQEFNICFTTVEKAFADLSEDDLPIPPGSNRQDGILKNEIRKLVSRRKEVKNLMKQEKPGSEKYQQYNIRQLGLKLTANSMYGCLGFQYSRFYAKTLAAMVTSKGRELLMHTKTLVENENFMVIYGDTDSIMVNTNTTDFQKAKIIGQKLKQIVNKNYSLLELDIDGIYKRLLLLKKKKYAALTVDPNNEKNMTPEMKGLDIVRRDWSELAKDIGEEIVNLILTPSLDRDTLVERIRCTLADRKRDLDDHRFPLEKFEILKQLTRDPAEYRDMKSQPHAIIARRLNESKKFRLRQGDIVKYVICTDGTNNPATQRGYHTSEILANKELHIDKNYYLAQQIHPVVTRLIEPIEEIDAYQVAEILGLDPSSYRKRNPQNGGLPGQPADAGEFSIGTQQDFSGCDGLAYECPRCSKLNVIRSPAIQKDNKFCFGLANCLECGGNVRAHVNKKLRMTLAEHIKRNARVIYTCDDIACGAEATVIGRFQFSADGIACTKCQAGTLRKNNTDKMLYDQQCFFKFITDLVAFRKRENISPTSSVIEYGIEKHYKKCHTIVCSNMENNSFSKVDLSTVFAPLIISKK